MKRICQPKHQVHHLPLIKYLLQLKWKMWICIPKYWFTLFCREANFVANLRTFLAYFFRPEKYVGVPKMTIIRYDSLTLRPKGQFSPGAMYKFYWQMFSKCWQKYPMKIYMYYIKCTFPSAQKPSNWHLFPKCWQHISNTNIYITKCTFPYPAPQRAHRKPPTDIYPPNVGRIYPIQIYILQHVHSLTLGPKGRTENLQLTYFPQMLAAKIQ